MAKITYFLLICLYKVIFFNVVWAQSNAWRNSIPVVRGNDTLFSPWAGGLNNPLIFSLELNFDGKKDLVIFDRSDNFIAPFLNVGQANNPKYRFAPHYKHAFPDSFMQRIQFEDLNCDGKKDIIANNNSNIVLLKNTSVAGQLQFSLWCDTLLTDYGGASGLGALYVSVDDVPAWHDIDSDGDIDLLTYDILGYQMEYHKNFAQELLGRCDTMILKVQSTCFGHFYESYDYATGVYRAVLNNPPCFPGQKKPDKKVQHSGGAILALNLNGDSLTDIIVSDNGPANAIALFNGGSKSIAHFTFQDSTFPNYNFPIDITSFPAYFYQDVTGDAIPDLLASPYQTSGSLDQQSLWLYHNVGSTQQPDFRLQWQDWLQHDMIDVGTNAIPAFFDWNQDGLTDLVIGNRGKFLDTQNIDSGLSLYKNTGTNENPIYTLVTNDYLGLMRNPLTENFQQVHPAFGDLNGDNNPDLLIGFNNGQLWYYNNGGLPGDTAKFTLSSQGYQGINVTKNAAPFLYDLDGDNDLDLLVGAANGKIFCYQNVGTATNPSFTLLTDYFGKIRMKEYYYSQVGNAKPFVFNIDNDPMPELLVGSLDGYVYVYDNIYLSATDSFPILKILENTDFGAESSPSALAIGTDSIGFMIGTRRGGLCLLKLSKAFTTAVRLANELTLKIFPNPATNQIIIQTPETMFPFKLDIYDVKGETVKELVITQNNTIVDVQGIPDGLYLFKIFNQNTLVTKKIVIHR